MHRVQLPCTDPDDESLLETMKKHGITRVRVVDSHEAPFEEYRFYGAKRALMILVLSHWGDEDLLTQVEDANPINDDYEDVVCALARRVRDLCAEYGRDAREFVRETVVKDLLTSLDSLS